MRATVFLMKIWNYRTLNPTGTSLFRRGYWPVYE